MAESSSSVSETKLKERKKSIATWLRNPYNLALVAVLIFAVSIRLYYFWMTHSQTVWWDEAEYMLKAKRIALDATSWHDYWSPRKPILLTWIFVPFFMLGISETIMRFVIFLFSIAGIYGTYLVSREFFDKKIALIATAMASVFWVNLFFTGRFLVELPATTFFLFALYHFHKGFVQHQRGKHVVLFGLFFGFGFLMRVTYGIFLIPFLVYLLFQERHRIVFNKDLWIAGVVAFAVTVPFFIWLFINFPDDPIGRFIGASYGRFSVTEHGAMGLKGIPLYFADIPNVLKLPFFFMFLVGIVLYFADLILGLDLLLKKEYPQLRLKLFMIIWIILPLIAFGVTRAYVEQRDSLPLAVFYFSFASVALMKLYSLMEKSSTVLGIILVSALLIVGAIPQLQYSSALTKEKVPSYKPVEEAAVWIQANSQPADLIYTMSSVQNLYYSERNTESFSGMTQEEFEANATLNKPRYLVLSVFEPYWLNQKFDFNQWISQNSDIIHPVNAWFADAEKQQPMLIIYEFSWNNFTEFAPTPQLQNSTLVPEESTLLTNSSRNESSVSGI